jgi:hypothetical protein
MSLIYSDKQNVPQFFDEWDWSTFGLSLVSPEIKKWSGCRFSVLPNDYLTTER